MCLRLTRVINKIKKFATSAKLVNSLNDLHFVQSFYVSHHQRHQSGRISHANKLCARLTVFVCVRDECDDSNVSTCVASRTLTIQAKRPTVCRHEKPIIIFCDDFPRPY